MQTKRIVVRILATAVLVAGLGVVDIARGQVVTEGLLSYWTLDADDTVGTTTFDVWGDRDGTFIGNPQVVTGNTGQAIEFDGDGDYIVFDDSGLPAGTAARTMSAWVKPEGSGVRSVLEWGTAGLCTRCAILVLDGEKIKFCAQGADVESRGSVVNGEWHQVTETYDGSTVRIYIDGVLDNTQGVSINTVLTTGRIGGNLVNLELFQGCIDEVCIYGRALSDDEVAQNFSAVAGLIFDTAHDPEPRNKATNVSRDLVLSWVSGDHASSHDVYFGTALEGVENASRSNPLDVLVSQGQTATTYDVGRLQFGQTYYWRVDETDATSAGTIFEGNVWSFTVEPPGYPLAGGHIRATASSVKNADEEPENAIDGSGLSADDLHSVAVADMWRTSSGDTNPWIMFAFDKPFRLHEMLIWNHNSEVEADIGVGIREAAVEYSVNGSEWTALGTVEFAQATGQANYAANTTVAFDGAVIQYVRVTPISNWGGVVTQYGLSEVRFLYVPMWAREPDPASGATGVAPETTLNWRAGRQGAMHTVYLSNDEQAVLDGTAPAVTVSESRMDTEPLDLSQTYFWRVDEVNDAEDPALWFGDVWSFTIADLIVVDGFESYTDEEGERIFDVWVDGYLIDDNGSLVGYGASPFEERTILHGGSRSMPFDYDNTGTATNSIATRTFAEAQNWTQSGVQGLVLYFCGDSTNAAGQLYVKINGTKVAYDGDPADLLRRSWNKWYIPLADVSGVNLSEVTSLSIGVDNGGKGMLYIDDIVLTAADRGLIVPSDPATTGLVAHWAMDEDAGAATLADSAGGSNNATVHSGITGVEGKYGKAIQLGGVEDPVTAPDTGMPAGSAPCTISVWFKQTSAYISNNGVFVSYGTTGAESGVNGQYRAFCKDNANAYRTFHWDADMAPGVADFAPAADVWHHAAFTFDKDSNTQAVYLNGILLNAVTIPDNVNVVLNGKVILGDMNVYASLFNGYLDEVRIYDRALSWGEIAWLSGRTVHFDIDE